MVVLKPALLICFGQQDAKIIRKRVELTDYPHESRDQLHFRGFAKEQLTEPGSITHAYHLRRKRRWWVKRKGNAESLICTMGSDVACYSTVCVFETNELLAATTGAQQRG